MIDTDILTSDQKQTLRDQMVAISKTLLGIPYKTGKCQADYDSGVGQWRDLSKLPANLDCEGLTYGVCRKVGLKFVEGAQQQFDLTVATDKPQPGDFVFFGHGKNITQIYHVGMVYDDQNIIEARGHQEGSSFKTGEVILRPRAAWENYNSFVGYRSHPKLI